MKNPLGGYGESVLRAGGKLETLSHCEIRIVPGEPLEGRVRAANWDKSEALFAKFREMMASKPGPDGLVCEINVSLDLPPEISADPDFWPRLVLLPDGNLLLRARSGEEAQQFLAVFTEVALRRINRGPETWTSATIDAGTQHNIMLKYDPEAVRRVVAKIAYGLHLLVSREEQWDTADDRLRAYIRGLAQEGFEPVTEAPETFSFTTGGFPCHQVVLSPPHDIDAAIVRLYGCAFRVDLGGSLGRLPRPVIVLCNIDGSGMRHAGEAEVRGILADLETLTFERPAPQ